MFELLKSPQKPVARLLLCHGAGAPISSDFCQTLSNALAKHGIEVWGLNFAYMKDCMAGKRRPPSKIPLLVLELESALEQLPSAFFELPVFFAGKSMGARVVSEALVLSEKTSRSKAVLALIKGVIGYGYPFHPPKKDTWRTEHFVALKRPFLILQGERDPFGNKVELLEKTWPLVRLQWLTSADHDFTPLKRSGLTQQQLILQAATLTRSFIDEVLLGS